ncbi:MAG TPA: hypothetical protein VMG99_02310 [Thermoplasmata archaeon]|nr:hypothetical protein [Thermoplasmata archaeon]
MFSRREREYLRRLAHPGVPAPTRDADLPSPVYRRKLRWSVRRKAGAALDDWELLAAASRVEPRLLSSAPESDQVPVHAEPIAAAIQYVARHLRSPPRPPEPHAPRRE